MRGGLAGRWAVSSSPEEKGKKDKYTLGLKKQTQSLWLREKWWWWWWRSGSGEGWCKQGWGKIPTEPASPTSRTYLFFIACTRLPLFHPALPFSHSPCLILLFLSFFYTVPIPPLSLPEALSSELPRFFIKELSLKPSNYYGEREMEEGTWGEKSVFHCFYVPALSIAPFAIHVLYRSYIPFWI